jgi:hypothetical protein
MQEVISREPFVKRVSFSYSARAARSCLNSVMPYAFTAQDVENSLNQLNARWFQRLQELQRGGWSYFQREVAPGKLTYFWRMRRCLPVGGLFSSQHRYSCRHINFCPWCWCRHLPIPTYKRLRSLVYKSASSREPSEWIEQHPCDLYVIHSRAAVSRDAVSLEAVFEELLRAKKNFAGVFRRRKQGGAVICSTIEPATRLPNRQIVRDCWALHQRILWLLPAGIEVAGRPFSERFGLLGNLCTVRRVNHYELDRPHIAQAVGNCFRYPRYLLFGPAEPTIELLDARRNHSYRLVDRYGMLRDDDRVRGNFLHV